MVLQIVKMESSNKVTGPPWLRLEYYEGWLDTEGRTKTRGGRLKYHEFHDWLDLKGKFVSPSEGEHKATFRILYSPLSQGPFRLGVSANNFTDLQRKFNLHNSTIHAFLDNNGAFSKFFAYTPGTPKKLKHLVLKVPNCINIGYDALSLSYNPKERTVFAFYHGIKDWGRLLNLLENKSHLCFHPIFLPTALFYCHRYHLGQYRDIVDKNVFETEYQIGYAIPGRLEEVHLAPSMESLDVPEMDYEIIVRRLHSYQTELATMANVARFSRDCGDSLMEMAEGFERCSSYEDEERWHEIGEEIAHEIECSRSLTRTLLSQVQSLKERVQSQVNLIFSLITQDENKISRSIAEHSAAIAVSSKRDSTAMKTVAFLTIIFLPATFVATFFSMSMFNWNPSEGSSPTISPYIWLYWAISIPLTIFTLLLWRFWWKAEDKKYDYQISSAKERYRSQNSRLVEKKYVGEKAQSYSRNCIQSCFFRYFGGSQNSSQLGDEEKSSGTWKKEE